MRLIEFLEETFPAETFADVLVPLVALMIGTCVAAIPIWQMLGSVWAVFYAFFGLIVLCLLRRWVISWGRSADGSISPSMRGLLDLNAIIIPWMIWILLSWGVARFRGWVPH